MNHVDIVVCHKRPVVFQAVVTLQLVIDLDLIASCLQVSLATLLDIIDLTRIDLFCRIRLRLHLDFTLKFVASINQVTNELGFDDRA